MAEISPDSPQRNKINKMKQLLSFLFKGHPMLVEKRQQMLTTSYADSDSFLRYALPLVEEAWSIKNDLKSPHDK